MNSKSNRSYKLRTKQMAIHVRAFGQVDKPVVTTKTEEELFTIDDLRNGRCAVSNDRHLDILQSVLRSAFPKNNAIIGGWYDYYFARDEDNWGFSDTTSLPTQSAIKFFNQINK